MSRRFPRRLPVGVSCCAAAALLLCGSAISLAAAAGRDGFNGVWIGHLDKREGMESDPPPPPVTAVNGSSLPFQPWSLAINKAAAAQAARGQSWPGNNQRCLPAGVLRAMRANYPWRLMIDAQQVTLLFEEDGRFSVIPFRTQHQAGVKPTWAGDAIAHWRGNTLVIDMTAFNGKTPLPYAVPITTRMHMVHELQLSSDGQHIEMTTRIDDPGAFTAPFVTKSQFDRWPDDYQLQDYRCAENNQDFPDNPPGWSADWGPQ